MIPTSREVYEAKCRDEFQHLVAQKAVIVKYLRNGHTGRRKGVVIALRTKENMQGFSIGWALCKKGDRFNKYIGIMKAVERAEQPVVDQAKERVPTSLQPVVTELSDRACRYFNRTSTQQ